ncbi:sugar transporter SWEET1-like isoform X2 [Anneissia japonica]|uniref:sugar transporter SWEET1-like isoform X2 n=1 Tax=Anneissia japonica TaxID=1529436 RepID=UPI00142577AB|nr:sugar transporter SWEET1-like isoform X2 [Anneissia japonica]
MDSYLNLLSNVTILCTVSMFAAGIPSCLSIYRTGSTQNVPYLPFLMTLINNLLWFYYGILKVDSTLLVVNGIGGFLQVTYMVVYLYFAVSRMKEMQQTFLGIIFMLSVYFLLQNYVVEPKMIEDRLGLTASTITVLMYASPLAEIAEVIRRKNSASISLALTITSLATSSLWFLYGLLLRDLYIQVPNLLGIPSCLLRLFLLCKYQGSTNQYQTYQA